MKKFLGIICLIYSGIIAYVWIFNEMKNFLAPTMQIYLKVSLFPLVVIGLVLYFEEHIHYKFKVTDIILLLPIIMFVFAGNGRLSASFATNRMNFSNKVSSKKVDEYSSDDIKIDIKDYDFTNPDFEIVDENYYELANYLTFLVDANKYEGKTVRVRGMASKVGEYISGNYIGIGKYGITCCAADAGFVGFLVKLDNNNIKVNHWYEVEGVLTKTKDNAGYEVLALTLAGVKEIDAKSEEQYVYSCYTYGDGTCSEVDKYNLELKE